MWTATKQMRVNMNQTRFYTQIVSNITTRNVINWTKWTTRTPLKTGSEFKVGCSTISPVVFTLVNIRLLVVKDERKILTDKWNISAINLSSCGKMTNTYINICVDRKYNYLCSPPNKNWFFWENDWYMYKYSCWSKIQCTCSPPNKV